MPARPILVTESLAVHPSPEIDVAYDVIPNLHADRCALERAVVGRSALVVRNQTVVDAELLGHARDLKVVGRLGVGLDNVDVQAARRLGIEVVYAPRANTNAVAEYCIAQTLNLLRKLPAAHEHAQGGGWARHSYVGRELSSLTVGIIGFGETGRAFGRLLGAFGTEVVVHTRHPEGEEEGVTFTTLGDLLGRSDLVSVHVPLTGETTHLVDAAFLSKMKPGAYLINTSRGGVLDEDALMDALHGGALAGAALDVRASEPPAPGAFESTPGLVLSPHIGAFTAEAQARVTDTVMSDVAAVLSGREPRWRAT